MSLSKRAAQVGLYVGAGVLIAWAVAPVAWVAVSSISNRTELYEVPIKHWIPQQPTLQNYVDLLTTGPKYRGQTVLPGADTLLMGLRNSVVLAVGSAVVITLLSLFAGYAFSRLRFRGKQLLFLFLMVLV
ncbi:MAG: hypothetical protein M3082_08155, partial [Candidatus Dormibacteraeota bacterium]|nr:hypothetical protein [Candidatus Dormibacteraeota bacterium]